MKNKLISPPTKGPKDHIFELSAATISSTIPVLGGLVAKVLEYLPGHYNKRVDIFHRDLEDAINDLNSRNIRIEDIRKDESFFTLLAKA